MNAKCFEHWIAHGTTVTTVMLSLYSQHLLHTPENMKAYVQYQGQLCQNSAWLALNHHSQS